MKYKIVSQLNENGYFIGETIADVSPLEEGVYLIPRLAIDVEPPTIPEGHIARWVGEWLFEPIPAPEEPEPSEPTVEEEQIVLPQTPEELATTLPPLSAKDFRHMLDRAGLRDDIELLITQIEDTAIKRAIQNEYEYAQFFERTNPTVLYMINLLGLDPAQVNQEWSTPISLDFILSTNPIKEEEEIPNTLEE